MDYRKKYLKYKVKYLHFKSKELLSLHNQIGGDVLSSQNDEDKVLKGKYNGSGRKSLNEIKIINGPHELYYYNIPLSDKINKKILLLGESHFEGYKNCENKNTCIDMIELLDIVAESGECIDFFLEFSPKKTEGWNITDLKGGSIEKMTGGGYLMSELRKHALKLQDTNNIRVQKWDLRFAVDDDDDEYQSIGHDILVLRNLEVKFLENYPKSKFQFSKEEKYKDNIHSILSYLIIDDEPNIQVRNMINMLCTIKHIKDIWKFFDVPKYIISINEKLNKINNHLHSLKDYLSFLELELNILKTIENDMEMKEDKIYIEKVNEEALKRREENPDSREILYDSQIYGKDGKMGKIYKKINLILTDLKENPLSKLFNDTAIKNTFIAYFYEVVNNTDIIYKAIETEILFYKEMFIFKKKIKKSYDKFLKFCSKYPNIFGNGFNIRHEIIKIMTNENWKTRFGPVDGLHAAAEGIFSGGPKRHGLHAALTDLYTFLRMFAIFDSGKNRGPIKCSDVETPQKIIVYAGAAHIELYRLILDKYNVNIEPKMMIYDESYLKIKRNDNLLTIDDNTKKINQYENKIKNIKINIKIIDDIPYPAVRHEYSDMKKKYESSIEKFNNYIKELNDENKRLSELNSFLLNKKFSGIYIDLDNTITNKIGNFENLLDDFQK